MVDFLKGFNRDVKTIKLNNVDYSDSGMLGFLTKHGFTEYTRQYEMELGL